MAREAEFAAACFAVDPIALGGVVLRTDLGSGCQRWLMRLRGLLGTETPLRRVPSHVEDERLQGGTDLAATLSSGQAVYSRGLLAELDGCVLLLSTAERLPGRLAAQFAAALDTQAVTSRRAGQPLPQATRFAVVALDTAQGEEEGCAPVLRERLAIHLDLRGVTEQELSPQRDADDATVASEFEAIRAARARLAAMRESTEEVAALCAAALACGIESLRVPLLALRVARASAALAGHLQPEASDLETAARLVIGPRARVLPMAEDEAAPPPESQASEQGEERKAEAQTDEMQQQESTSMDPSELQERVLDATRAAIPVDLLASLGSAGAARRSPSTGRVGALILKGRRGRPAGVRAGRPRGGSRLNVVATLRAAAPWQRLRRQRAGASAGSRVQVRIEDFRVTWFRQRSPSATVFVIDASGSSAMHRLAEVKGAVELLLAECYVRRDQVAVIAFRADRAQLVLPPTRSLVRAKRCLAGLPGGGATPLAGGLDAARELGEVLRRRGFAPSLVLLTDGQGNVARNGERGRLRAQEDAMQAARALGAAGFRALLIDTAPRPQPQARLLADAMLARYLPLPYADARALAGAVQTAV